MYNIFEQMITEIIDAINERIYSEKIYTIDAKIRPFFMSLFPIIENEECIVAYDIKKQFFVILLKKHQISENYFKMWFKHTLVQFNESYLCSIVDNLLDKYIQSILL